MDIVKLLIASDDAAALPEHAVNAKGADTAELFKQEISPEQRDILQAACKAPCECDGKSQYLIEAAGTGCVHCCMAFIGQAGALVDGRTALMRSVEEGRIEIVKLLVLFEAKIQNREGETAMHLAAIDGKAEAVKLLLSYEAKMIDNAGKTALIHAVERKHSEIITLLLPHESDIADANGATPFEHAFNTDSIEVWKLFDPSATKEYGLALRSAYGSRCSCDGKSKSLIQAGDNECLRCCAKFVCEVGKLVGNRTALMKAAFAGRTEIVKLLAHKEAMIKDKDDTTALMIAAQRGHAEIVQLLIPREAKMVDKEGKTALMSASEGEHVEAVKLLIPHEAGMKNKSGRTALHQAAFYGKTESVRLLAPHEAKITFGDGWTALMCAAQEGRVEAAKILAYHEAKMTRQDKCTALMSAAFRGHAEVVKVLLQYEAGMMRADGKPAAIFAATFYHRKCFELLLQNGAESQTSKIPAWMLATYRGDTKELAVHQSEWQTKHLGLTVLDFALLGGQRQVVQQIFNFNQQSWIFTQQIVNRIADSTADTLRILRENKMTKCDVKNLVCRTPDKCKSDMLGDALLTSSRGALQLLRPLCVPDFGAVFQQLQKQKDEQTIFRVLGRLKCLGFAPQYNIMAGQKSVQFQAIQKFFACNPLKQKQFDKAVMAFYRRRPGPAAGVEKEAVFNQRMVGEVCGVLGRISHPERSIVDQCFGLGAKLEMNGVFLMNMYHYLRGKVQEMLDE